MKNTDILSILRRRTQDVMCKNSTFLIKVINLALKENVIKHQDLEGENYEKYLLENTKLNLS